MEATQNVEADHYYLTRTYLLHAYMASWILLSKRHSTYVITPKKPKFQKFLFGKIKKEEFARRFFKKKQCIFAFKIVK